MLRKEDGLPIDPAEYWAKVAARDFGQWLPPPDIEFLAVVAAEIVRSERQLPKIKEKEKDRAAGYSAISWKPLAQPEVFEGIPVSAEELKDIR
jgi:hypothetical protein